MRSLTLIEHRELFRVQKRSIACRLKPLATESALIVGAVGFFGFLALSPVPPTESPFGYVTAPVIRGDLTISVHATGTVEPTRLIDVSTELSGTLTRVLVKPNDIVKVGQVLAELEPTASRAQVARARAQLAAARARVREANAGVRHAASDLERKRKLFANRHLSEKELENAQHAVALGTAAVEKLTAEVEMAEADLRMAESNLAKTRIVSPVNGVVLRRTAEPGQTIAASLQPPALFRLAENLDEMEIKVDVDEADALSVSAGKSATFSVQAVRNRKFPARVERLHLGPEIVQGVVTYKAILVFDNRKLGLRPGMTAAADIVVEEVRGALLVPNAALRFPGVAMAAAAQSPQAATRSSLRSAIGLATASAGSQQGASVVGSGSQRRLLVVEGGSSREVIVEVGPTDGNLTVVSGAGLHPSLTVVVDFADAKR